MVSISLLLLCSLTTVTGKQILTTKNMIGSTMNKEMDFKNFDAGSQAGQKLIDSARQLEDGFDAEIIAQYSIMYDGCHNTTTWTEIGYTVVPLVRFTLCPSKYIHSGRCYSKGVGEYIVDLNTFMDGYLEHDLEVLQRTCENMRENCGCDDADDDGCIYHCYDNYGQSWSDLNCDAALEGEEERYGECQELEVPEAEDDDGGRRLADEAEDSYYLGPYCGSGGKGVFLTLYSDQYCNYPEDGASEIYETLMGVSMPYQYSSSSRGLVKRKWIACAENEDDDDEGDADDVIQFCEEVYETAGKCETNMTSVIQYPNTWGCDYINSLKGRTAYTMTGSMNGVAWGAFFGVSLGLSALGAVQFYLRSKKKQELRSAALV